MRTEDEVRRRLERTHLQKQQEALRWVLETCAHCNGWGEQGGCRECGRIIHCACDGTLHDKGPDCPRDRSKEDGPTAFYVATGYDNKAMHNDVRDALASRGWRLTHDWTLRDEADGPRASAEADLEGVRGADVVVVVLPGGEGTHAELGMALALGKRTFVCARDEVEFKRESVFLHHPLATRVIFGCAEDVAEVVAGLAGG